TVNDLLAGLRHWRIQPQVAMFFTGSIGLRGLAKQHGINANHLSDTKVTVLPPLPRDEAELFLRALMAGADCDWPPEMVDAVLDRMPDFHLGIMQYAFGELSAARVTSIEAVETVFEERVRPGIEFDFHAQFSERLSRRDGDLRRRLRRALALVGDRPGAIGIDDFGRAFVTTDPADEIEDTIAILVEDGFIHWNSDTRMLRLSDGLVRAWWKTRPRIPLAA
ncbi:MAG: hypothetical protein HQL39_20405, partial [Alphaproteobacteria bacterium]|nr:hypothetical protein [Alphaproteobacteria bacterium]